MNRWAAEGGNPFADAKWDEAWKVSKVTQPEWEEIRSGLRDESQHWLKCLDAMPALHGTELSGIISSVAQIAYHLGASRQVARAARVPREGTFA